MKGTYELDRLIGASPASASVLDIMAASGTKEASADYREPQRKRARLDGSSDLLNLLTTSAPVLDIFAASGSRPFPKEAMEVEVTCITKC